MSDFGTAVEFNPHETVRASILDASGYVLRVVECPRGALALQAGTGETLLERVLALGKRWDAATEAEVDAPIPPAPDGTGNQWDAARWKWISWDERNALLLRKIDALERAQLRMLREIALNIDPIANKLKLKAIDDAIVELRNQFGT